MVDIQVSEGFDGLHKQVTVLVDQTSVYLGNIPIEVLREILANLWQDVGNELEGLGLKEV